jgi:putative hydrolase of the HAD superfamily
VRQLPRVLLVDLDDTVLRYGVNGEGLWVEVVEQVLAASRDHFWADRERSRRARQDMFAARRAILAQAFERLGLSPESELVREVADAYSSEREARVAPFPGALDALRELRHRGHRLGLLTNGGAVLQRAKIERYELAQLFDAVRVEGEVGIGKPKAAAFAGALDALGAGGEPAAMIGDDLEADIRGAQAAGLAAVWVDHRRRGPGAGARPDRVVRSIAELVEPD